MDGKNDA